MKDRTGRRTIARGTGRRAGPRRAARRGVGLVELLIALAISASLLTATAVAIDASFKAYAINQEQSDLTQRARLAVHRMTTMLRTTKEHGPVNATLNTQFKAGKVVTDTAIDMLDLDGDLIRYRYDAGNKRLMVNAGGSERVVCDGVEAFTVRMEPMRSAASIRTGGRWDLLKRATITLTVRATDRTGVKGEGSGEQEITLSTSVMPRRNAW
jgi:prepilin-type N-terminal cleavage/methylation domain-containing protein